MQVLVTGGQGQLARALSEAARGRAGMTLVALGRLALDLLDGDAIERALGERQPDVLVNCAAYTAVDRAESEPERVFAVNAAAAGALASAAHRVGIPIVHISTDYVFDGAKGARYTEQDAPNPQTVYGRSKLEGEQRVALANPRHLILRTAWIHGPFGQNFVRTILRLASERPEIGVVADQHGCPTYACDLAAAILDLLAARLDRTSAGVYHVAGSGEATWHDVAERVIAAAVGHGLRPVPIRPITSEQYPALARRPADSRLDCEKLHRDFGVRLPAWPQGVERCVERLLAGGGGAT